MRTWDISKAKFYSELMNWLVSFFSLDAASSTEAEVHSAATAVTATLEGLKSAAIEEAKSAVKAEMDTTTASLQQLAGEIAEMKKAAATAGEQVTALTAEIETLKGQLSTKEADMQKAAADHKKQVEALSTEIGVLKTGAKSELEVKTETLPALKDKGNAGRFQVVENKALDEFFGRRAGN